MKIVPVYQFHLILILVEALHEIKARKSSSYYYDCLHIFPTSQTPGIVCLRSVSFIRKRMKRTKVHNSASLIIPAS